MRRQFIFGLIMTVFMGFSIVGAFAAETPEAGMSEPSAVDIGPLGWLSGEAGFKAAAGILREDQRPFLIYFMNDECAESCAQFEELVLSDPDVVAHIERFSRVVVNTGLEVDLGKRFGGGMGPKLLVMRNSGSAQSVGLPRNRRGDVLYEPSYVLEKMKLSGLA